MLAVLEVKLGVGIGLRWDGGLCGFLGDVLGGLQGVHLLLPLGVLPDVLQQALRVGGQGIIGDAQHGHGQKAHKAGQGHQGDHALRPEPLLLLGGFGIHGGPLVSSDCFSLYHISPDSPRVS